MISSVLPVCSVTTRGEGGGHGTPCYVDVRWSPQKTRWALDPLQSRAGWANMYHDALGRSHNV